QGSGLRLAAGLLGFVGAVLLRELLLELLALLAFGAPLALHRGEGALALVAQVVGAVRVVAVAVVVLVGVSGALDSCALVALAVVVAAVVAAVVAILAVVVGPVGVEDRRERVSRVRAGPPGRVRAGMAGQGPAVHGYSRCGCGPARCARAGSGDVAVLEQQPDRVVTVVGQPENLLRHQPRGLRGAVALALHLLESLQALPREAAGRDALRCGLHLPAEHGRAGHAAAGVDDLRDVRAVLDRLRPRLAERLATLRWRHRLEHGLRARRGRLVVGGDRLHRALALRVPLERARHRRLAAGQDHAPAARTGLHH